jgi:RimJ/RimL family protein N-acetyltransferase
MEKMPRQSELDVNTGANADVNTDVNIDVNMVHNATIQSPAALETLVGDWRQGLPILNGRKVVLRELRVSDRASLLALLTTDEVSRFISPPPASLDAFERFIAWTLRQRVFGNYACFAVSLKGFDRAIGIFQVRQLEAAFGAAEWGFAIGSAFWGTGVFQDAAELVLEFTFDTLGVHRLEARAAVLNGRGNGALVKIGAVQEAVLRKSFIRNGRYLDQVLYAVLEDEWRAAQVTVSRLPVRVKRPVQVH